MTERCRSKSILLLLLAGCGVGLVPIGAASQALQFVVTRPETHVIKSRFVDQEYEIHVAMPPRLEDNSERFPVLYMTDANDGLRLHGTTHIMQFTGDIPRFIMVGIGYPVKHHLGGLVLRTRDLTPVETTSPATDAVTMLPIRDVPVPKDRLSGAAPEFLEFIREQLIPFIDDNYPTVPEDRAYFGDSLGGLFGLFVLLSKPDTFYRYIIGSPSTWWAEEAVIEQTEEYIAGHKDLNARVFMAAGGLEEVGAELAEYRMVTNMYRIERMLRAAKFPSLSITAHVFPDETHTSVVTSNYVRGVRTVYDKPEMSFIQEHMMRSAAENR